MFFKKYKYFIILIIIVTAVSSYLVYYGQQIEQEMPSSNISRSLPKQPESIIGKPDTISRLTLYLTSDGELFLTDPLGRRTGIEPLTEKFFAEIPNSSYVKDEIGADFEGERTIGPVKSLDVSEPLDGDYKLQVISDLGRNFDLTIDSADNIGNFNSTNVSGTIEKDNIAIFNINYSSVSSKAIEIKRFR